MSGVVSGSPGGVPLHVSCEIVLPATGRPPERYFRLTESASADEIVFWRPLPLESGRRVELVFAIPGEGEVQAPALLIGGEGEHARIASLREGGAPTAVRERLARYARSRADELSRPLD